MRPFQCTSPAASRCRAVHTLSTPNKQAARTHSAPGPTCFCKCCSSRLFLRVCKLYWSIAAAVRCSRCSAAPSAAPEVMSMGPCPAPGPPSSCAARCAGVRVHSEVSPRSLTPALLKPICVACTGHARAGRAEGDWAWPTLEPVPGTHPCSCFPWQPCTSLQQAPGGRHHR
jgi:hypothetical protein